MRWRFINYRWMSMRFHYFATFFFFCVVFIFFVDFVRNTHQLLTHLCRSIRKVLEKQFVLRTEYTAHQAAENSAASCCLLDWRACLPLTSRH
ncbi:unnamed protein product [Ixodes persulcatus]